VDSREILEMALIWERQAHQAYLGAANRAGDAAAREMLQQLARWEEAHAEQLLRLLEECRSAGTQAALCDQSSPPVPSLPIPPSATHQEVLRLALRAERDAGIFYRTTAFWFPEGEARATLERLADDESRHGELVEGLLERFAG
jgi:rubrerythrin